MPGNSAARRAIVRIPPLGPVLFPAVQAISSARHFLFRPPFSQSPAVASLAAKAGSLHDPPVLVERPHHRPMAGFALARVGLYFIGRQRSVGEMPTGNPHKGAGSVLPDLAIVGASKAKARDGKAVEAGFRFNEIHLPAKDRLIGRNGPLAKSAMVAHVRAYGAVSNLFGDDGTPKRYNIKAI